jgi:hypothetical protein
MSSVYEKLKPFILIVYKNFIYEIVRNWLQIMKETGSWRRSFVVTSLHREDPGMIQLEGCQ